MHKFQEILQYWFGSLNRSEPPAEGKSSLWFKKSDETDQEISEKFSPYLEQLDTENYGEWLIDADRCLALIILTDQFTRNIYRNRPQSFAYDHIARDCTMQAIAKGFDSLYHPVKRIFFYMPLEHSENIETQKKCRRIFENLVDTCPAELKKQMEFFKEFSEKHYRIIERFGRFPHRNLILGRESTPEEAEFLKTPGSSF
jgi:uncharacterized protein (DUF924 family)